jgi:hypothetical protein
MGMLDTVHLEVLGDLRKKVPISKPWTALKCFKNLGCLKLIQAIHRVKWTLAI